MKLLRVGAPGLEKPAILHSDGTYRDLSAIVPELRGLVLTPEGMARIRAAPRPPSARRAPTSWR